MTFVQEYLAGRPDLVRQVFESAGLAFNGRQRGAECTVLCPFHNDHSPSLAINTEKAVFICRVCGAGGDVVEFYKRKLGLATVDDAIAEIREKLGLGRSGRTSASIKSWRIRNSVGEIVATHHFLGRDENGKKKFAWEPTGIKTADLPLYNSEKIKDWNPDATILLVEGEKTADALTERGYLALATVTGASGTPSAASLDVLRDRHVVLWPDHDEHGRKHMARIGEALRAVAKSVRVLAWGEQPGDDAFDFFARGGTTEQLDGTLAEAPEWKTTTADTETDAGAPWTSWPTPAQVLSIAPQTGERLTTGIPTLDAALRGGMSPGRVYTFQGPPGMTKTALAKQIGRRSAREHHAKFVGVFADEGNLPVAVMLGQEDGFERKKLESGDAETLTAFTAICAENEIYLPDPDDAESTVEVIAEKLKDVPQEKTPIVLGLDSAQTCRTRAGDSVKSFRERVEAFMAVARTVAKRLPAVVIVISQANRASYRHKKEADNIDPLAAGAESRAIEFGSDVLLHFEGDAERFVTVKIVKNRLGTKTTFRLRFDPVTATLSELDEATAAADREAEAAAKARAARLKVETHILKIVTDRPGILSEALADLVGVKRAAYLDARGSLVLAGRLHTVTKGKAVLWYPGAETVRESSGPIRGAE